MYRKVNVLKSKCLIFWFSFSLNKNGIEITLIPDISFAIWKKLNIQLIFRWLIINCGVVFSKGKSEKELNDLYKSNYI